MAPPSRLLSAGAKQGSFASTKAFNARLKAKASEPSKAIVLSKALSPIEESPPPIRDGALLIQEGRIMVYVRLRPMSRKEKEQGAMQAVDIPSDKDVVLTEFCAEGDYLRSKRLKGRHFTFDVAFSERASQQEVYAQCAAPLVEVVLEGRNASVFCYGATGAGKTHTMLGNTRDPGVMVLALQDLFRRLQQKSCSGQEHSVKLSYLEVYNETVKDLLAPGRPLVLRDGEQGITAAGLTQFTASSAVEVMSLLQRGNQNRTTEATRSNETSSRSHAILQVFVECVSLNPTTGSKVKRCSKLSLIDLAGSERALATEQRTLRSFEGANINKSLLALSSCIRALVEGKHHVPYRNSKLTQLLKDSLGGACHTAMIANVSPAHQQLSETQNTLHWADRAKEIRTKAPEVVNEAVTPTAQEHIHILSSMEKDNANLRAQLAELQNLLQHSKAAHNLPSTSEVGGAFLSTPQSASHPPKMHSQQPSPLREEKCPVDDVSYRGRCPVDDVSVLQEENRALSEQLGVANSQKHVAQAESRAVAIDAEALRRKVRVLENECEENRLQAKRAAELQQRVWDLEAQPMMERHVARLERELTESTAQIQALEQEVQGLRQRERTFEATVAALNHEHAMKLKQKDDFIRQVMKERKSDNSKWAGSVGIGKEDVRPETPSWCRIPRPGGVRNARASSPPLMESPKIGSASKKRTFWDITNTAGSPSQSARKRAQMVAKSAPAFNFSARTSKQIAPSPR